MARRVITVDPSFGSRLRELRTARGMSLRDFGTVSRSYVHELESGHKQPTPEIAAALDRALDAGGALAALVRVDEPRPPAGDDEIEALELARRVAASDVGEETIARIEAAFDDLATRYSVSPPAALLERTRRHLAYAGQLLDATARKTLVEHRRLIVVSAWLSLLAATLHIDLEQHAAAAARLATAAALARHAEHPEIEGWTLETQAWQALTDGDVRAAVALSQGAQAIAPRGSSAYIQATAQEGRAWARLGDRAATRDALDRVARLVGTMERPDRPEHHYRYDPDKALAYLATTLAWAGDPAAEQYAREVIASLRHAENGGGWPRRLASAQIDLALALVAADKPDEAATVAQGSILSGRLVPSNHWRAAEVVAAIEHRNPPEADELREAFEMLRRGEIPMLEPKTPPALSAGE